MDPFVGEIRIVGFNFAPQGWASCDGQLMPILQNQALFSLLGITYGGNGQTTFALPDFRGRAPIHMGQGPGLSQRFLGEKGGEEGFLLPTEKAEIPEAPDHPTIIAYAPGGQQGDNMQPFLTALFIIALQGHFPTHP